MKEIFNITVISVRLKRIHCSVAVCPPLPWLSLSSSLFVSLAKKTLSTICYLVEKYIWFLSFSF